MQLVPYADALRAEIRAFNGRLDAGGVAPEFRFDDGPGRPAIEGTGVTEERHFAVEDGRVRGGVLMQVQSFWVAGEQVTAANVQLPLSEGIVNRRYAYLGMWLMKQVVRRYPHAFAIGMGGVEQPLPQLLKAMTWAVHTIPFIFRPLNVARCVRELPPFGPPGRRRAAAAMIRWTGAGWLSDRVWNTSTTLRARGTPRLAAEEIGQWGAWADVIWARARDSYDVVGVRDASTLPGLYRQDETRISRYALRARGETVGWVVLSLRQMVGSKYFGDLCVGTVLDALCMPGHEGSVARAATRLLAERGADLAVTNQSHPVWRDAFRRSGYLSTRSNYGLATSPQLVRSAPSLWDGVDRVQFTRGDGDGRIHL